MSGFFKVFAVALLVGCFAIPAHAAEDDGETIMAVIKSAGAKGGEIAAKALAGVFYDAECKNHNITDPGLGYICQIMGSVSGRTEDAWKENVTRQLEKISAQLDTIESTQNQIQRELLTEHAVNDARFKQVTGNVIAGTHLTRVEGLWEKFQAQFDELDQDVTRPVMLSFAREIMKSDPHTILADLNAVLTKPALDGQSLIRYPFYEWRLKNQGRMSHELRTMELYDFAERKFVELRSRQDKVLVMYLWAAAVLQTQCDLGKGPCQEPPRPIDRVKGDYARYTTLQIEEFNAAVDWFVLNFSTTRTGVSGNFLALPDAPMMLRRANFLTAATRGTGEGLWGRVISMGNRWDGTLQVDCGTRQTLKPVLEYKVPVAGSGFPSAGPDSGPLDWWVSTKGNGVYDEVHFARDWQMYHYHLPAAKVGRCTIPQLQAGYLPWVPESAPVVKVKTGDEREFPFGSFVAIQRAGGSYALLSGSNWTGHREPERVEEGPGQREKVTYDWTIEPNAPTGPRLGLYMKGRAEYKVGLGHFSSRIHNRNSMQLASQKDIRFPDGGLYKLHYIETGSDGLLSYDIENNDTEEKKGKLDALAAVVFREPGADVFKSPGMVINASYGKTGDHKKQKIAGEQVAPFTPRTDRPYRLTYAIYFDLETEGRGTNASEYMYSARLGTAAIWLTR